MEASVEVRGSFYLHGSFREKVSNLLPVESSMEATSGSMEATSMEASVEVACMETSTEASDTLMEAREARES